MFQLIVAVIAIVLVAVMTIAAIWYGGNVYDDSATRAQYAQNMNSAAQIEGAMQMYYNDNAREPQGEDMALLQYLVTQDYLKEIPEGDWRVRPDTLYKPIEIQDVAQCARMNRVAGYDITLADVAAEPYLGCPPCNGIEGSAELALAEKYKSWPGCQFVD